MTQGSAADAIVNRALDSLIPYARNARTHSDAQVAQIAASIREFGFTSPVLVDSAGTIIAGHGRVMAARQLGLQTVPTICVGDWSDAQRRAYIIADNKLALNAGWDHQLLAIELDELRELKWDMDLLGFEASELNELIGTPNFGPSSADEQGKLDALAEKIVQCPFCSQRFDVNALPKD